MHLKSIRVRGFKSFARVTELILEPGVAVVIGPNGSGKSNLAEAVMWALGEQSPSSLRGGSMQDVIFAGSDGRRASGGADVELVFDNYDGSLPLPTQEVSVGRRVHRDGQTTYTLNRSPCRLADVVEIMSGVSLGRASQTVIGQGRVEWFLASKPEDRRALIEEAAGLGRYKRRRERSQLKVRETLRNLERIADLEREVSGQLTPLRRQASAAEQRRTLEAELAEVRGRRLAGQLAAQEADLTALRAKLDEWAAQRVTIDAELAEVGRRRSGAEERFARAVEENERRSQRLMRARVLEGRVDSCVRLTEQRIRLLEEMLRAGEAERDRLLTELSSAEGVSDSDDWAAEEQRLIASLAAEEQRHRSAAADLAAGRTRLSEARSALARAGAEREEAVMRVTRLTERRAAVEGERDAAAATAADLRSRLGSLEEASAKAETAAAEAGARAVAATAEARAAADKERNAADVAAAAAVRVRESAGEAAAVAAELEHVAAALSTLREVEPEVEQIVNGHAGVSLVASHLQCEAGYERALAAALVHLQSDVQVAEDADAWGLLDALRAAGARLVRLVLARQAGEVSASLPPGEPLLAHVQGAEGTVRERLALVRVVDDLRGVPPTAGGLAVTRDGAYYAAADGVLGLSGSVPAAVLFERRAHLQELRRRAETLGNELEAASEEEQAARERLAVAAAQSAEAARAEQTARDAAQGAERAAQSAAEELRRARAERERRDRESEALDAEIGGIEEEVERLDAEAARLLVEVEALSLPVATCEEAVVELEEAHDRALTSLTRLRVEVEERRAAAERSARERREALRRAEERRRRLDVVERRLAALPETMRVSGALQERFTAVRAVAAGLVDRLGQAPAVQDVGREDLRALADREAELRRRRETVLEENAAAQVRLARLEEQREEVTTLLDEVGERLERAHFEPPQDADEAARLDATADRLQRRLEGIGPVNPLAEAECAELGDRLGFLREQRRDLERSLQELEGLISELSTRIDADFAETFQVISHHFSSMVATLFPGGKGTLKLVEGDESTPGGVAVEVKPGRKLGKRLSMLSGGERALAAIAFLMALVLARPAPFYILDEVEAALDDVNIGRFVSLLREYRHRTQFIIITHQKRTMEAADLLYGVTMGSDGVSHVVSARMAEEEIDRAQSAQDEDRAAGQRSETTAGQAASGGQQSVSDGGAATEAAE